MAIAGGGGGAGCDAAPEAASAREFKLLEKGDYQALYGPSGRVVRLLWDSDDDKRADAIVFYGPEGKPERAEIDSDRDGTIDRWEEYGPDGQLLNSATTPTPKDPG